MLEDSWKTKGNKSGPKNPRPPPTAHEAKKASLSKDQIEQLIRLLKSSSLSSTPCGSLAQTGNFSTPNSLNCTSNICVPWIIDSSASEHIPACLPCLKLIVHVLEMKKLELQMVVSHQLQGKVGLPYLNSLTYKMSYMYLNFPRLSLCISGPDFREDDWQC